MCKSKIIYYLAYALGFKKQMMFKNKTQLYVGFYFSIRTVLVVGASIYFRQLFYPKKSPFD